MIHQLYQKQVEAWKEKHCLPERTDGTPLTLRLTTNPSNLLLSRHKDTIELMEAEIERKKGKRATHVWNMGGRAWSDDEYRGAIEGYNSAIDEDIAYLEEQIKLIKKEI